MPQPRTLPDPAQQPTLTVPEAARVLGIGQAAAYASIHRDEIPHFTLGRRIVVPTARLLALLGVDNDAAAAGR